MLANVKYVIAAVVGSLLAGCAGGSSTPAPPAATALAPNHRGESCPCLYTAIPYSPAYPAGSVTVYPAGTFGDVTPLQQIAGGNTGINNPGDVAVDANRNIYVANFGANSVLVYAAGATGNVAPMATISGSNTGLAKPFGVAVDPVNEDIYVANKTGGGSSDGSITIYSPGSNGNASPIGTIAGSNTGLDGPTSLTLDALGNVYVPNLRANSVTVYAAGSTGNATPIATISGSNTRIEGPYQVTLDAGLNIYVANYYKPPSVTVYSAGANGNVSPIRMIAGQDTLLDGPDGVALDKRNRLYVANYLDKRILIYHSDSTGDVRPRQQIKGSHTGVVCPSGLTIF